MRITLTEARRQLPTLLKRVRDDPRLRIEITVREETVAELRAASARPRPGEAVERLLALRRRQRARPAKSVSPDDVSERVDDHLYGAGGILP